MADYRATNLVADAEVFAQSILNVRDWANLINKPASFPPSAHTHSAADITTGSFTVGTFAANVDITGALSVTGAAGSNRDFRLETGGSTRWQLRANAAAESGANAGSDFELAAFDDAGAGIGNALTITRATRAARFFGAVTLDSTLSVVGLVSVGTTVTAGASGGDVVLASGKILRHVESGGAATRVIIGSSVNDNILLGNSAGAIAVGGAATVTGASGGDVVMGYGKSLRGANSAGTGTFEGVRLNGDSVQIAVDASTGNPGIGVNAVTPAAGQTAIFIHYNGSAGASYQRVTVDAVDTAGVGYRALRVPN